VLSSAPGIATAMDVMTAELIAGSSFTLSAGDLPPRQGLFQLQEIFDSRVQLRFETRLDRPVDAVMTVQGLPGVRRATMASGMDVRLERSRARLADGEDDVCLIVNLGPAMSITQRRRQSVAGPGDGALLVYREAAVLDFRAMTYAGIRVPFAALAPFTRDIEAAAAGCVRSDTPALRLLQRYLASLAETPADPALARLVAAHVHDLMALVIGATRDGADLARHRGVRAARLQVIRQDLAREPDLTITEVALRQGVSPRYVQMLFEEAGTTFTDVVLQLRLHAAHRMLTSPRYADWSITAIALEAGFGDLSYFNRRFRQRFDRTPSDLRAETARAARQNPDASDAPLTAARSPESARRRPASR
jgi:AraC-like DNA-binding protein